MDGFARPPKPSSSYSKELFNREKPAPISVHINAARRWPAASIRKRHNWVFLLCFQNTEGLPRTIMMSVIIILITYAFAVELPTNDAVISFCYELLGICRGPEINNPETCANNEQGIAQQMCKLKVGPMGNTIPIIIVCL